MNHGRMFRLLSSSSACYNSYRALTVVENDMKTLKNLAFAVLCCGILSVAVADTEHPIYTSTWTVGVSAYDTFPWTNESGATWSATTGETLALPGTLVLPDALKCAVQRGAPHHVDLATAAQGVAGEPDWTFTARRYGATVNIGSVMLDGIGLLLLVR